MGWGGFPGWARADQPRREIPITDTDASQAGAAADVEPPSTGYSSYPDASGMGAFPSWPSWPSMPSFGGYGMEPTRPPDTQQPSTGYGTTVPSPGVSGGQGEYPSAGTPFDTQAGAPMQAPSTSQGGMGTGPSGYPGMGPFGMTPPWMAGPWGFGGPSGGGRIQTTETDAGYEITVDLQGNQPDDVKLYTDRGHLTIQILGRGDWSEQTEQPGAYSYSYRRSFGTTSSRMPMPQDADLENVTRRVENGRLIITIPRSTS
jgi:HSP20 family molecular chaperone IbpA